LYAIPEAAGHLPREEAESLATRPQLLTCYLVATIRRLSRQMAEATRLGMALEGLAITDLGHQQH
jgi:hypothetical protein